MMDFYSEIYDDLVYDEVKNDFEIGELKRLIKPTRKSRILDVGSGSGHHVKLDEKIRLSCRRSRYFTSNG